MSFESRVPHSYSFIISLTWRGKQIIRALIPKRYSLKFNSCRFRKLLESNENEQLYHDDCGEIQNVAGHTIMVSDHKLLN